MELTETELGASIGSGQLYPTESLGVTAQGAEPSALLHNTHLFSLSDSIVEVSMPTKGYFNLLC